MTKDGVPRWHISLKQLPIWKRLLIQIWA